MFWFIVEAALVNSWVLYKVTCELGGYPLEYTHFTFRQSIALALASEWEKLKRMTVPGTENQSPTKMMRSGNSKQVRIHLKQDTQDQRISSPDKHISFLEKIPPKESWKKQFRQLRCQQCKTRLTTKWCKTCAAPLCVGKCYSDYHSNLNAWWKYSLINSAQRYAV
jgi:hypothetical protein